MNAPSLRRGVAALSLFALGALGCARAPQKSSARASDPTPAPAPAIPRSDAEGLVRTLAAALGAPIADRDRRADILLAGCSEIPTCAGACAGALHKASSNAESTRARLEALEGCFPDFKQAHDAGTIDAPIWADRHLAAYADRVIAANVLRGDELAMLERYRAKLDVPAPRHLDLTLAESTATTPLPPALVRIYARTKGIAVDAGYGAEPANVVVASRADPEHGWDEQAKGAGPALELAPLLEELLRVKSSAGAGDSKGKGARKPLVYVDRATTYQQLVELLYTLQLARLDDLALVVADKDGREAAIPVNPNAAARSAPAAGAPEPLDLTAAVTKRGLVVRAQGKNVGPGCKLGAPGVLAADVRDAAAFAALASCVHTLKAAHPSFASERAAHVGLQPGLDFQTLIRLLDALRADFPEPIFTVVG